MSKNLQINYIASLTDLTPEAIKKMKANFKSLADSQIENNKRIFEAGRRLREGLKKQHQKQSEDSKKFAKDEMMRARIMQLNSRKSYMEKVRQLKMIRGKEESLVKYIQNKENQLRRVRSNVYADPAKQYQNTLKELALINLRNRAETMLGQAITANNRKREQALRAQERLNKQALRAQERLAESKRNTQIGMGVSATAGLISGKTGLQKAFSSAMSLEQIGISMRAFLGEAVGTKVLNDMKQFAKETGFSIEDTTGLAMGLKAASANNIIKFSEDEKIKGDQISDLTRIIGRPILAYGKGREGRGEIIRQLFQIMSRGYTNVRQDLDVMQAQGFYALKPELEKIMGKSVNDLDSGEKIKASVMLQAFINSSKSKEVDYAIAQRRESFGQSVDSASEQASFTSGGFGLFLAKTLGLPSILDKVNSGLANLEEKLSGVDGRFDMTKISTLSATQQLILFGTTTLGITLGIVALTGAFALLTKTAGGLSSLGRAFGIASAIYLVFTDWKSLFDDLNENGLKGFMNQLDKTIAILSVLGTGFLTGGILGLTVAATGLYAVSSYKAYTQASEDDRDTQSKFDTATAAYNKAIANKYFPQIPNMTPISNQPAAPVFNIQTNVNVEKDKTTTKTLVRGDYSDEYFDTIINKKR